MSALQALFAVANSQVGYIEVGGPDGRSGNVTKYWTDLEPALQGSYWCAVFVSWVFIRAGFPLPHIDRSYGFINCASAENWAKKNGLWDESGHYAPGDILIMGNTMASHTGIVISDDGRVVHTVEGNSSVGSQTNNGGGVGAHARPHGSFVRGAIRTAGILAVKATAPAAHVTQAAAPVRPLPAAVRPLAPAPARHLIDVDGDLGPATITSWQQVLRTPVDGVISPVSSLVKAAQRVMGFSPRDQDGALGPQTIRALQRRMGTPQDGKISHPVSTMVKILQQRLNAGRF